MHFLKPHLAFLRELSQQKNPAQIKSFIINCSAEDVELLVEICFNLLKGNINLSPSDRTFLAKFARQIRKFSRQRSAPSARRVIQEGEVVPLTTIAAIVLSEFDHTK